MARGGQKLPAPRHLPNYVEQGIYAALFYRILNVSRKTAAGAKIFATAAVCLLYVQFIIISRAILIP